MLWIIARMADFFSFWYGTVMNQIRHSVGRFNNVFFTAAINIAYKKQGEIQ
jgi:hypothetical protein